MAADEFSTIRNRIVCRMVNAKRNAELLKDRPYTPIADLAVIYEIRISNSRNMTVPFTYDLMSTYNILIDDIHNAAIRNIDPWTFDLYDYLSEFLPSGKSNDDRPTSYVITTNNRLYGAAAILRNEVMDQIAQIFPDGFYLIPSSVHEFIVISKMILIDDDDLRGKINNCIREVNREFVKPDEYLSDHFYNYDIKEHRITMDKESVIEKLNQNKENARSNRSKQEPEKNKRKGIDME